jgi:hypothetical protein
MPLFQAPFLEFKLLFQNKPSPPNNIEGPPHPIIVLDPNFLHPSTTLYDNDQTSPYPEQYANN